MQLKTPLLIFFSILCLFADETSEQDSSGLVVKDIVPLDVPIEQQR